MGKYEHLKDSSVGRPIASDIVYSKNRKELWMIGDCKALVDGDLIDNEKLIDKVMIETRALWLQKWKY